jgi:hypothetical protein
MLSNCLFWIRIRARTQLFSSVPVPVPKPLRCQKETKILFLTFLADHRVPYLPQVLLVGTVGTYYQVIIYISLIIHFKSRIRIK